MNALTAQAQSDNRSLMEEGAESWPRMACLWRRLVYGADARVRSLLV